MQTMPPMVMARAPKAGAVQPLTRKMAAVAMRVAMVMPETGEAEEPTMPTMRAETVTKEEAEDHDQQGGGEVGERADLGSGDGVELEEDKHEGDEQDGAAEDDGRTSGRSWGERCGFTGP